MAALTLAAVESAIADLVANPNSMVDYKEGDISVSYSQKLDGLMKLREQMLSMPVVDMQEIVFEETVGKFGQRIA